MQAKSLSAKKKELLFIVSSVFVMIFLAFCLFWLVGLVADKASQVYTARSQQGVNQTQQTVDKYFEVAGKLFPEGAPPIE